VLERAVIVAGQGSIMLKHLPGDSNVLTRSRASAQGTYEDCLRIQVGQQMSEVEQAYIDLVLKHTNNNKTRAAQILGVSLRTLHNRVRAASDAVAEKDEAKSADCVV